MTKAVLIKSKVCLGFDFSTIVALTYTAAKISVMFFKNAKNIVTNGGQ